MGALITSNWEVVSCGICRWDWTSRADVFLSSLFWEFGGGNIPNMFSAGRLLARFPGGHCANSLMSMLSARKPGDVEARCGGG